MGIFTRKFNKMTKSRVLTRYIYIPTLYPMGSMTFAIACSHCKNMGSKKCSDCKNEKKSGFESKFPTHADKNLCVCCGVEIPEGSHVCVNCAERKR